MGIKKVLATWLEDEILADLDKRIAAMGITKSGYIRQLIERDLAAESSVRTNKPAHARIIETKARRKKDTPDDYFHIDPKKEAEWKRRKAQAVENLRFERPTVIF